MRERGERERERELASDDARHAYLWYGFSFVGPEADFWLSEMKKLLNPSAFSPSDLATVSFAEIHVLSWIWKSS